jgi:EmrB/QacA subfamily drug resistance transporter
MKGLTRTSPVRPWAALLVLCTGTFAVLLDSTIVNVALPSLITSLHASLDQALWVVNGYLLVFCSLLIVGSRLGDLLGRRRLFTAGLALFAIASALCGLAQSPNELVAARILQGIGAAALAPQAMAIIQQVFRGPPGEQSRGAKMGVAFGVFSSMVGLAAVSGPVVGGLLTSYLSWRWVFYVNLPVAAAGIVLAYVFVPESRHSGTHRLDLPGVIGSTAGLAALVFGLTEGQRYHWDAAIIAIIGAGVATLIAFALWEKNHPEPLVPPALFSDRTFTIMVVLNVAVQFALQSMLLVNSINLQSVLGFTAVHAGLTALPLTIALTATAPFAGRLTDRFGGKWVLAGGLVVYSLGIGGVAAVSSVHATSLTFAPVLLLGGLGMGAIFAPLATMAMSAAPRHLAGAASGTLNTARQLGATLGGAVTGAVLAGQLATAVRIRAIAAAAALPPPARAPFVNGLTAGTQVGRGQAAATLPAGTPARLVPVLRELINDVFGHGYIAASRPTLACSVGVLLAGAALCLALRVKNPAARSAPHAGPGDAGAGREMANTSSRAPMSR